MGSYEQSNSLQTDQRIRFNIQESEERFNQVEDGVVINGTGPIEMWRTRYTLTHMTFT